MKRIGKFRKNTPKAAWFVLLFTIFPFFASAQERLKVETSPPVVNVAAVVKPRHIQFGEKARLELTISGDTFIKHIKAPKFNFLPAFLAVPLHSETVPQLKSDKIAVSMAWVYELIPQAVGDFALSDIRFDYQDNFYFANPGSIRVSGADTYQETLTGGIHQVEAEVDTANPYLKAPLKYTFRYRYTAVLPTRESPTPRLPTFPNFVVEIPQTLPPYTQQIRGKTFWVEEHVRQLYPQRTGQIVLAPAEMLLPLRQGRKILKTAPLTLTVQSLPAIGKPPYFSGAIGEYQISAQTERSWVEAGSAISLSVRISGRGNMQTVTPPKLPTITGVVVNRPNLSQDSTPTSRLYTYTLTPAHTGTLHIPSITYAYFNPSRAVYATTQTTPIPLSVRPNPNDAVEIETEDTSWKFWVILSLAILLVGGLIAGFLWYRSGFARTTATPASQTDIDGNLPRRGKTQRPETQSETPASQAHTALAELTNNDTTDNATVGGVSNPTLSGSTNRDTTDSATPFPNALAQTLYQYLESTLTLSQRNIDTARESCVQAQVSDHIIEELVDILTKCDYHRFAPVPLSTDERAALITRAEAVINGIENLQNTDTK